MEEERANRIGSSAHTREDAERNMHEAVAFHVHGLIEDGQPIPECQSFAENVAVD
jgi:predicted RNase H-like HicB family nuclease